MVDRRVECYGSPPRQSRPAAAAAAAIYTADGGRMSAVSSSSSGLDEDGGSAVGELFVFGEGIGSNSDSLLPRPVKLQAAAASGVDIQQVACGVRHAVLVTKQGQLFTWGEECGGRLGHGLDADLSSPQPVEALGSTSSSWVSCGEYHTCAITTSGELYTWGDGTQHQGLTGHGRKSISRWKPKRVAGSIEGVHVATVSCGPWHTVLITSAGQLLSFGDGTFGVLGHGNRDIVCSPKEVECLRGLRAVTAACGPWHTAAVVEVVVGGYAGRSAAASGKLFTWGDGDKNRLGHGDKETKLVPTCVAAVVDYNFRQVACGHSLTVALTTKGQVFTMGSSIYGQLGDPQAAGRLPGMLKIGKVPVEQVACGAYHVAASTSKMEVYTWGKGANGRLGHGDVEDRSSPTLVEALKDKVVRGVACGSSFTAVICLQKSISSAGSVSACAACRQSFGFTRKKHICYNCGAAHCHSCSTKKAMNTALAPTSKKAYRVCDPCFVKLSALDDRDDAILYKAQLPPLKATTDGKPKRSKRPDCSSRVSPAPILWGGINAPATFNIVVQPPLRISKSVPQSRAGSRAASPLSRRPSPPQSLTPARLSFPNDSVEHVSRVNEALSLEVNRLRTQVEKLSRKCELHEEELLRGSKQLRDAFAMASAESAKCKAAKEVIMSLTAQLKELAERVPPSRASVLMEAETSRQAAATLSEEPGRLSDAEACRSSRTSDGEWVEQDHPGVYITLKALPDGGKDLKRVRFSRKRFTEKQAEAWWQENRQRFYEQYDIRKVVIGSKACCSS